MTTRPALAIAAGIILAVFFTAGLLAPVLAPYDLEAMDLTARLLSLIHISEPTRH